MINQATAQTGEQLVELPVERDAEARAEVAQLKNRDYFIQGKDRDHAVLPLQSSPDTLKLASGLMARGEEVPAPIRAMLKEDPRIVKFARAFVKAAHQHGIPCMVTEIFRSPERQNQLYAAGRTKAKAGQSPHNVGKAVDIVHGIKAWDMTARQWGLFGIIGKEIARRQNLKVSWGGDWTFYDPAHWEIASWKAER